MRRQKRKWSFNWLPGIGTWVWILKGSVAALVLGSVIWGMVRLREHVGQTLAYSQDPPAVILRNRPAWMSDGLAAQIARSVQPTQGSSALDRNVLAEVAAALQANSWVKQVHQVRRGYERAAGDTIEIECEYRAPMALVASNNQYILIDTDGVRLPESCVYTQAPPPIVFAPDGRVNIRIIEGVAALPPREGYVWPGEDLKAGLDLVKLLYGRDYADDVIRVSVANFSQRGHRDGQITLLTRQGTKIAWGEPINRDFYAEVHPTQKLNRLAALYRKTGRCDGGYEFVSLRMDAVQRSAEPLAQSN